jgi:hypothetical protein
MADADSGSGNVANLGGRGISFTFIPEITAARSFSSTNLSSTNNFYFFDGCCYSGFDGLLHISAGLGRILSETALNSLLRLR